MRANGCYHKFLIFSTKDAKCGGEQNQIAVEQRKSKCSGVPVSISGTVYLYLAGIVSFVNSNDILCLSMTRVQFETEYFKIWGSFNLALRGRS